VNESASYVQTTQGGARRGEDFLRRLREYPRSIWHRGELVTDVTTHSAFRGCVHTLARLYDLQWEKADVALYDSPDFGHKVGRSFMMPRTQDDLRSVSNALRVWEDHTHGMMGRLPTYLNRAAMGLAAGAAFFSEADSRFGMNAMRRYEYLRENDLCMTATLSVPQANRAATVSNQADPFLAARIKQETDAGIIIRGCRVLATLPIADELLVYSGAPLRNPEQEAPYAFVFSIPSHTQGIRFICRESVDYGRSHYDHPLGSRFEEMDAVVVFDDVLVPWENVFVCHDVPRCNSAFSRTGAAIHMDHQTVTKNIVKAEFMLGLASLLVNSIGAEVFQHIYEKLSELWLNVETMKACLRAAEADAKLDDWAIMRPDENPLIAACILFSRMYPRMVEIIQQIGASGLVAMPTEDDVRGPLAEDIRKFYQAARAEAFDRIPMFRLAWDASMSAFASRQVLYERFSRGDPIRVANALMLTHQDQLQKCAERVSEFIRQGRDEAFAKASQGTGAG
jgi:4-hydroxyphenylacetate 3-monooxygenase